MDFKTNTNLNVLASKVLTSPVSRAYLVGQSKKTSIYEQHPIIKNILKCLFVLDLTDNLS